MSSIKKSEQDIEIILKEHGYVFDEKSKQEIIDVILSNIDFSVGTLIQASNEIKGITGAIENITLIIDSENNDCIIGFLKGKEDDPNWLYHEYIEKWCEYEKHKRQFISFAPYEMYEFFF